jgi:hypothetical protein
MTWLNLYLGLEQIGPHAELVGNRFRKVCDGDPLLIRDLLKLVYEAILSGIKQGMLLSAVT